MVEYKDLAITGDLIVSMPESERWFEIVDKPFYEEFTSYNDPTKKQDKLVLPVKLSDGRSGSYYPNKRSHRAMARLAGTTEMDDWVGKKFMWGKILKQIVGQSGEKDVLYVTSLYPITEKVS